MYLATGFHSPKEIATHLVEIGAHRAILLDGGGSPQFLSYSKTEGFIDWNPLYPYRFPRRVINGLVVYNEIEPINLLTKVGATAGTFDISQNVAAILPSRTFDNGVELSYVPQFAPVNSKADLSVSALSDERGNPPFADTGTFFAIQAINITGEQIQPKKPFQLTYTYRPDLNSFEDKLALFFWDGNQWIDKTVAVDVQNNTIVAETDQMGSWAVLLKDMVRLPYQSEHIFLPLVVNDYTYIPPTPTPTPSSSPPPIPTSTSIPTNTPTSTSTVTPFDCNSLPFDEVALFEHISCQGEFHQYSSTGLFNLRDIQLDNEVSSIHVPIGQSVEIYQAINGGGQSRCIEQKDSDLRNNTWPDGTTLNDSISSIEVFDEVDCGIVATPEPNNCDSIPYDGVAMYVDISCEGSRLQIYSAGFFNLNNLSFDELISSIHVAPGFSLRVYEHIDKGGQSRCIQSDRQDLRDHDWPNGSSMNDTISSIVIYENGSCAP